MKSTSRVLLAALFLGLVVDPTLVASQGSSISAGNGNNINGNNVGSSGGSANAQNNNNGGGHGDPVMTDFEGKTFEFFGKPDGYYTIYSDAAHQVNMGLFPGHVDGHEGTYMDKFGISFNKLRVLISLADQKGDIVVQSWNNERIAQTASFASGKSKSHVLASGEDAALNIYTEPWRPFTGRTVNISTGTLQFSAWSTPAGVVDSDGIVQPAYLNFNISLLTVPVGGEVEGIIGESLNRIAADQNSRKEKREAISVDGDTSKKRVPNPTKASEDSYAVSEIFGTDFAFNKFSPVTAEPTNRRALSESIFSMLEFPFTATSAE